MFSTTAVKLQAVFFILLLGGYEAVRISERVSFNTLDNETPQSGSFGKMWKAENEPCSWNMKALKCQGSGCSFRPLILDRSLSASCRLSVNHMLRNSSYVKEYVGLQAELLTEKSISFRKAAMSTSWFKKTKWQCLRAGGHMLQASGFLAAVKEKVAKGDLPTDLITEVEPKVAGAIKSVVDSLGKDGDLVLEFKKRLAQRNVDASKNPEHTAKLMVVTVQGLLSKNESEREQARVSIKNMPSESQGEPSEEEDMEIKRVENQIKQKAQVEDVGGLSRIEDALAELTMKSRNDDHVESSLIQSGLEGKDDDKVLKIILTAVLLYFLAPVILVLLIFLIFPIISLLAAAVGSGGGAAVASIAALSAR